jgi:hypothetical protein
MMASSHITTNSPLEIILSHYAPSATDTVAENNLKANQPLALHIRCETVFTTLPSLHSRHLAMLWFSSIQIWEQYIKRVKHRLHSHPSHYIAHVYKPIQRCSGESAFKQTGRTYRITTLFSFRKSAQNNGWINGYTMTVSTINSVCNKLRWVRWVPKQVPRGWDNCVAAAASHQIEQLLQDYSGT